MVEKITNSRIMQIFLNDYSARYYLREIASKLKKPHQSIKPYLNKLVKSKILNEIKRKKILEYSLNLKNKLTIDYLIIAEKEKAISILEKNVLIKTLFDKLNQFFDNNTFIIFGSFVTNPKTANDIDLICIGQSNIKKNIDDFQDIYNKEIHFIQTTDFKKINKPLINEIYKKHIILNNADKIIRFFERVYG